MSFQVPLYNAHMTSCLAHIHKPKKVLETKVNKIKGRDKKKAIQTKADEERIVMLYLQYFLQYFYENHIKILCGKLLLVLIWTHHWNYIFYSPILANNNLLLKIYYENIMVVFLN